MVWSWYCTLPNPHEQNIYNQTRLELYFQGDHDLLFIIFIIFIIYYISREIMMILQKDDEKRKYCIYVKFPFLISNI